MAAEEKYEGKIIKLMIKSLTFLQTDEVLRAVEGTVQSCVGSAFSIRKSRGEATSSSGVFKTKQTFSTGYIIKLRNSLLRDFRDAKTIKG